ncbi:MAG: sigma-54-dependent Fis family transcriptional regulator [Sterolibacteriaceae bacterium]|nr:sigma-54-dependent Fis family transcriptional regulator [Candidatus Methylophosphatis haderslevensis]
MNEKIAVLVVEDDESLREAVAMTLACAGHKVTAVDGGPAALARLAGESFNLVLSDLRMDPMDGIELLRAVRDRWPSLPVLLMTAYGDVERAVAAMQAGASDFMQKPFKPEELLDRVARYAWASPVYDELVAQDPRTRETIALAERVAASEATVLLTGESGTGKEVFARFIHTHSPRAAAPFVAINCAAIPENLLEATLFGYEKGAFTGAQNAQAGKFEQAQGGTILLDEISEMPLALQAKMLRVLQEREVERVGGKRPIALDIRVLATSNRNMMSEVVAGRFREDLYYRLNVFPIAIPALRERPADILPLARHLLARHGARCGRPAARLSDAAAATLSAYPWPGNVREMENVIQRALILAPADTIEAAHLQLKASGLAAWATGVPAGVPAVSAPVETHASSMKDLERQHILDTLASVGGSRKKAVEKLGISERTLRYKLQQYRAEGVI